MSPRRRRLESDDEPLLFDLPLDDPHSESHPEPPSEEESSSQAALFTSEPLGEVAATSATAAPDPSPSPEPAVATVGARLLAGSADLLIHAGVGAAVALGLWGMALEPRLEYWPAFATLLAAFSFLYTVVCLAFWGQTAGMAWCHLYSHDRLQRPLSFRQASLRWVGSLLTVALAGLPLLLVFAGASLSDVLSRSVTLDRTPAAG